MNIIIIKILSLFFFLLFFFYNISFYKSDNFKLELTNTRTYYKIFLKDYGSKLKKSKINDNYKTFIDNSEYFKKNKKQPLFWELIK